MRVEMMIAMAVLGVCMGCATPKMPTPSGRPEVTVAGASVAAMKTLLANKMADRGYAPKNLEANPIVFEKEAGMAASLAFGSMFNPTVHHRVKFTLLDNPDGVRVLFAGYAVSNPGSGLESENELTGDWKNAQKFLDSLKR